MNKRLGQINGIPYANLPGLKFAHLTIKEVCSERNANGRLMGVCLCDCGNECVVDLSGVVNGLVKHCKGCPLMRLENPRTKDLTGQTFGELTVLERSENNIGTRAAWICRCSCGRIKIALGHDLLQDHVKSCGECGYQSREARKRHVLWKGKDEQRLAHIFYQMKQRCYNPNCTAYPNYGGRGIYICDEWLLPEIGIRNFISWAKANAYYDTLSIDRIDNDGPYAPWNCRWVDSFEQANNTRKNVMYTYDNETRSLAEWARICNIPYYQVAAAFHKSPREMDDLLYVHRDLQFPETFIEDSE